MLGAGGAGEEGFDGEDLQARVFLPAGAFAEPGGDGFGAHDLGRLGEGEEEADLGLVAGDGGDEVLHHRGADVLAAFDADDDLADFLLVEVAEKLEAINAAVRAFLFALEWLRLDERDGPPLELILVARGEVAGAFEILGRAVDLELAAPAEGVLEPLFDERDGEAGNAYGDP